MKIVDFKLTILDSKIQRLSDWVIADCGLEKRG